VPIISRPTISRRALLGASLAAACCPVPPAHAAAPTGERLPVGALFPFSGGLSLLGDESFRGLDLAAEERNAAGGLLGRPIALERGDAAEAGPAASEAKRLMEQGKVALMFGSYSSVVSFAASAVTELGGVPFFELDALADPITERGLKLLFRTGPLASACGTLAVDTVADLLAPLWQTPAAGLKLAVLYEDGLAGTAVANAQEKRCKERGLSMTDRIAYGAGLLDLAPVIQRLRGAGTDVLLHTGLANDVVMFHRAMKQAGWRPRMVIGCGGGYALNDTAQALGADFDGVLTAGGTQYHVSDVVAPGVGDVAAAYQRKYGAPPRSGHSLLSYAGARVVFDAIEHAGSLDRDKLRASLLATDLPPGSTVGGWGVKFDDKGQNARAVPYLAQWQKGALLTVAPTAASVAELVGVLGG
jgi:branched-chain amino acid transport system substrate-binding protein